MTHTKGHNSKWIFAAECFPENFDFFGATALMFSKKPSVLLQQDNVFQEFQLTLATLSKFLHFLFQWSREESWHLRTQAWKSVLGFTYCSTINLLCDLKIVTSPLWVLVSSIKWDSWSQWALWFCESGWRMKKGTGFNYIICLQPSW